MTAISASNRLCQGMRFLMPGNKSIASATNHKFGIKSLASQFSSLRLSSTSTSDFFHSSTSSSFAGFHSSASINGPKKKPMPEVVRPVEDLPEKPKLPITSWLEFCATNRPLVRRAQPNLKTTEILRVLSEMWKRVSPSEKEKYNARYRRRREEYDRTMEEWNKSVSAAEKSLLLLAKKEKREAKEKGVLKAQQKREQKALEAELGKPKRPLPTYFRFLQEQRILKEKSGGGGRGIGGIAESAQFVKSCGEKYRQLPDSERERLMKTYNAEKKTYDLALEAWHKRMNQDGRSSFIGARE